ncbi:hypothetical protein CLI64_23885 [Nostoc sp. CENA543]|nr:hypothetical protein CLI64_23885 [Nostoc sp. CENA543]MCF4967210.1 hypothetical protein [Nostoc sp. CMAA1605]
MGGDLLTQRRKGAKKQRRKEEKKKLSFPLRLCVIPIHENLDTDVNHESFAASKFFNCVSVAGRSR